MTQPIADKPDTQVLSFKDFVDSVFTELNSPTNEWYADLSDYGYYKPTYWENTLIPLAIRLYELAQTDDAIYWWLLRKMSLVDLCKDGKEDFRKKEVFDVLLQLKSEHRKIILENSVPEHAKELQKALDNDAFEAFKSLLPLINYDDTIYNIGRVLIRINDVRNIFERTIHHTKGDSLGRLFVLFREYYRFFASEYKYYNRYCDGMANNVFLALYQTQYREDKVEFCDVAIEIGELWVKNLILVDFFNKDNMPKSVREVLHNILLSQSASDFHDLETTLSFCDNEKQTIEELIKPIGGWMDLEKYTATFGVFNHEWIKTTPPFSCRCLNVRRRVRRPVQKYGNVEHRNIQDNCNPYIDSKNAIPIEDLEALRAQEVNKNAGDQELLAVSVCDSKPATKGNVHEVKGKTVKSNKELKPIYFPDDWEIPIDKRKEFLAKLHGKLKDAGYLKQDSLDNFIFIFSGYKNTSDEKVDFKAVDWGKGSDQDYRQLQVFCIVFYNMRNGRNEHKKSPWSKLTPLFTVNGETIQALSTNASKAFQEEQSIKNMLERITDVQKKILQK